MAVIFDKQVTTYNVRVNGKTHSVDVDDDIDARSLPAQDRATGR